MGYCASREFSENREGEKQSLQNESINKAQKGNKRAVLVQSFKTANRSRVTGSLSLLF